MLVIPALRRWGQEGKKFKVIVSYIPSLKSAIGRRKEHKLFMTFLTDRCDWVTMLKWNEL